MSMTPPAFGHLPTSWGGNVVSTPSPSKSSALPSPRSSTKPARRSSATRIPPTARSGRASHSTNIKERRDCSTALFNAAGETLCQAEHIPIHLGSFLDLIKHIMRRYPTQDIRPGDAFIGNDAYEGGGTHLPDIVLAEPIFIDGRLVAWTVNLAHHADFVDRGHAHIFQEGLRIPPVRLYRAGELQADVQDLILLNCQVPSDRQSDLRAQRAANRVGVQRFQALAAKYGTETVLQAGEALMDYAERKMRAAIAAMPDGTSRLGGAFAN